MSEDLARVREIGKGVYGNLLSVKIQQGLGVSHQFFLTQIPMLKLDVLLD